MERSTSQIRINPKKWADTIGIEHISATEISPTFHLVFSKGVHQAVVSLGRNKLAVRQKRDI
jgi:hypothetical protein